MISFIYFLLIHPYFVSSTNIEINERGKKIQISSEYFCDDLEQALQLENPGAFVNLGIKKEIEKKSFENREAVKKYIQNKFLITIEGQKVDLFFLDFDIDNDKVVIYLEGNISGRKINNITVKNTMLNECKKEQVHLIFLKYGENNFSAKLSSRAYSKEFKFLD